MSHDSVKDKELVGFPDGRMMLFCKISDSSLRDAYGKRVWTVCIIHPDDSLFWTKETLKQKQTEYVEKQLENLKAFNLYEYKNGYAKEYKEPTLDSYDFNGTVFPGGSRIRNGKAFYGGRPMNAAEYFERWETPKGLVFKTYDKDFHLVNEEWHDILEDNIDDLYVEYKKTHDNVCVAVS